MGRKVEKVLPNLLSYRDLYRALTFLFYGNRTVRSYMRGKLLIANRKFSLYSTVI